MMLLCNEVTVTLKSQGDTSNISLAGALVSWRPRAKVKPGRTILSLADTTSLLLFADLGFTVAAGTHSAMSDVSDNTNSSFCDHN